MKLNAKGLGLASGILWDIPIYKQAKAEYAELQQSGKVVSSRRAR